MDSVAFFVTCMADLFRPQAARAAVRVMQRRGYEVTFPSGQTCCGQFSFNAGYHREASQLARHFLETFEPTAGPIVGISGSCVAMVVHEYPTLLYDEAVAQGSSVDAATRWQQRAASLASRTVEWSQWLARESERESEGPVEERGEPLAVMHHMGCHMRRILHAAEAPQTLLEQVGVRLVEPDESDQCCGFGGTYSMTEPAVSTALADAKWEMIRKGAAAHHAPALTGADLGCLFHLQGRASRLGESFPVVHLAELVDLAETGELTNQALQREGGIADGGTTSN